MSSHPAAKRVQPWARAIVAALPDAAIAVMCAITWFEPYRFGTYTVKWIVNLMLVEFVVVHSAGFMGLAAYADAPKLRRAGILAGLTLLYTAVAAGFSAAMHAWWPLVSFWALCLNRMSGVLLGQPKKDSEIAFVMASWAMAVLFYLVGAFATIVPSVPHFGITPEVIAVQDFRGTSGMWIDEPQRTVAFAMLYFAATALWELFGGRAFAGADPGPTSGRPPAEQQAEASALGKTLDGGSK